MDEVRRGQVSRSAAEIYEELFAPALFRERARYAVQAGGIRPGQSVLDVACGTGVPGRSSPRRTARYLDGKSQMKR